MRLSLSLPAALLGLAAAVRASNVIDLTPENFADYVGNDKPALVEFYAPWCGHCKNLAPVWEQLADAFPSGKVVIAKTDADGAGRPLGEKFGVQGYPTLKWFPAGSESPVDYQSGRDLDSLVAFVTKESGVKSNIKPPAPPAAKELDSSNFDDIVDGSRNVLVAFTAPWCGHCKNMKPTYEKIAKAWESESDCLVAHVNADEAENKPIASRYDVRSFPTIKFFPKGAKEPIAYDSGRTEEQFAEFLNKHCGTNRTPSGLLNDLAGKIAELDQYAQEYISDLPSRAEIVSSVSQYVSGLSTNTDKRIRAAADYYLRAMDRIKVKGDAWLTKEQGRLANLLSSPSLAPTKLDEIKIKANILRSFVAKKAQELKNELYEDEQIVLGKAKEIKEEL